MILVQWKDKNNNAQKQEAEDLWQAMALSKHLYNNEGITAEIVADEIVMIGAMGASGVVDGKLPDKNDYLWVKRRSADGKKQYIKRSRK